MCVVSNMGDQFTKTWPIPLPGPVPTPMWPQQLPYSQPMPAPQIAPAPYPGPTREQFEEFLDLFRAAKKIDAYLGTPDCEMEEKLAVLKEHAKRLGLNPDEVFK